jgi:hypothetical protein
VFFRHSQLGQDPVFTHKYKSWLEELARDEHSSFLMKSKSFETLQSLHALPFISGSWLYFQIKDQGPVS